MGSVQGRVRLGTEGVGGVHVIHFINKVKRKKT